MLSYMIPDVPEALKEQIKRERYLTQVILHETNIKHFKELMKPIADNLQDEIEEPELDLKLWSLKMPAHVKPETTSVTVLHLNAWTAPHLRLQFSLKPQTNTTKNVCIVIFILADTSHAECCIICSWYLNEVIHLLQIKQEQDL